MGTFSDCYTLINNGNKNQQKSVIKTMATRLITNPAFIISLIFIWPLANTIALGGVPIGIMLAQLAANVIAMPSTNGFMPTESARLQTTGEKTITCAILLITSLIKSEMMVTINKSCLL